jgi:hypothetical protein
MEGSATFKLYAISLMHGGTDPSGWFFKLYPKKSTTNGWWYYQGILKKISFFKTNKNKIILGKSIEKSSPNKLLLHTKGTSKGNVDGFLVDDLFCWLRLQMIIISGKEEIIEVDRDVSFPFFSFSFVKSLFTRRFKDVTVVATLEVI